METIPTTDHSVALLAWARAELTSMDLAIERLRHVGAAHARDLATQAERARGSFRDGMPSASFLGSSGLRDMADAAAQLHVLLERRGSLAHALGRLAK